MRAATVLLAAPALACAWAGEPDGIRLEATTDLVYRRNLEATGPPSFPAPEPRPRQYQAALALTGSRGPWTGGITAWDVNFYPSAPNLTLPRSTATVHRKYLQYDASPWTLRAGDCTAQLGRGLLLSVVQNPAVLKDDTVYGADAHWRNGRLDLHGLAGTLTVEDQSRSWRVAAGEASVEYLPGQRLALTASNVQDGRLPPFGIPVGLRQGRSITASGQDPSGRIAYYLERGHLVFRDQRPLPFPTPVDPTRGDATYANLSLQRRAWFLMAEYKAYTHFDDALNNPPLADRDTEKNDLYDASGRRLYVQYALPDPDLTVFLSGGRYRQETWEGHHVHGGFKLQDAFGCLDLACTYGLKTVLFPEKKTQATLTWRPVPLWSLDLTLWDKRNRPPGADPYSETDLTVQVARASRFSAYVIQQRTTVPVFDAARLYYGGLRIHLPRDSYLDLSGGRLRGGEVCAGGQCALLPPFRGWKLAARLRW